MPAPTPPGEPFIGYRVTLSPTIRPSVLHVLRTARVPVLQMLASGDRPVIVPPAQASRLYETAQSLAQEHALPFPLQFTPLRPLLGRARRFEAELLAPTEILSLVHDGFFCSARCREAAIAAVEACGALPVPALALPAVRRGAPRARCERHVDTLIEREAELHQATGSRPRGARA